MPPNTNLIRDYSTFGDLTQRDIYLRHKHQAVRNGNVENFFYHVDTTGNVKTNLAVEKVSMAGSEGRFHIFTKGAAGAIDAGADATATVQVDPTATYLRSGTTYMNAANAATLTVTGHSTLESAHVNTFANVSTLIARNGANVQAGTLWANTMHSLNGGTFLGTTAMTSLRVTATANISSLIAQTNFIANGNATLNGTLSVAGNTTLSNLAVTGTGNVSSLIAQDSLTANGPATLGNTLSVTGLSTLSGGFTATSGNVTGSIDVAGNVDATSLSVTGLTTLANTQIDTTTGALTITGSNGLVLSNTSPLVVNGNVTFNGPVTMSNAGSSGNLDLNGNFVVRAAGMSNGNVRVALDQSNLVATVETWNGAAWAATTSTSPTLFRALQPFQADAHSTLQSVHVNTFANVDTLLTRANANVEGTLGVTGTTTLADFNASGAGNVASFGVRGTTNLIGTVNVVGSTFTQNIQSTNANVFSLFVRGGGANVTSSLTVLGHTTANTVFAQGHANVDTLQVRTGANVQGAATFTSTLGVLGSTTLESVHVNTFANVDTLLARSNANVEGTLGVTGFTTLSDFNASGAGNVASFGVRGNTSLIGTLNVGARADFQNVAFFGNQANAFSLFVRGGGANVTSTLTVLGHTSANTVFAQGHANVDTLTVRSTANVQGAMGVAGTATLNALAVTNNATVGGTLGVTGATTLSDVRATGTGNIETLRVPDTASINLANITTANVSTLLVETGNLVTLNVSGTSGLNVLTTSGNVTMSGAASAVAINTGSLTTGAANHATFSGNAYLNGARTEIKSGQLTGQFNMANQAVINAQDFRHFTATGGVHLFLDRTNRKIDLRAGPDGGNIVNQLIVGNGNVEVTGSLEVDVNANVAGALTVAGLTTVNDDLVVNGNLQIMGTTTKTEIQSNTVQVGDLNVELGYLETSALANLNGAGITIGGPSASFTRPELVFNNSLSAWTPNYDLVLRKTTGAIDVATIDTDGYFMSANAAAATVFTKMDSTSFNFSDKWRMTHVMPADEIQLQHYEDNAWVTKFTYTA